jgi:hypothetical protein
VLEARSHDFENRAWVSHPFCLAILRRSLDDVTPTKRTYSIEGNQLMTRDGSITFGSAIPALLADPKSRRETATERICDSAARRLAELAPSLPAYHPMLKSSESRLAMLKEAFDRNPTYRLATGRSPWDPRFVPVEGANPAKN